MSDSASNEPTGSVEPVAVEYPRDIDPILAQWLNRFDAWGFSADVTLTVGGFLVSGTPLPLSEFYRSLGKTFETAMNSVANRAKDSEAGANWKQVGELMRTNLEASAEQHDVPSLIADYPDEETRVKADEARAEIINQQRAHIFLKRAVIHTPAGDSVSVGYWRGRLSHVSGWFIGRPSNMDYEGED